MTAAPGSTRVVASHMLAMCSTSSSHGQPDGVALAIGCYVHGVDHVADEEQAPAARALPAVQLLQQVRLFGRAGLLGRAALVADGDDDLVAVLGDLDLHRDLGAVLVAMLDGVHRGLGDRGLQLLKAFFGQPQALHAFRDPGQREALVAGFARQLERVESAGRGAGYLSHRVCSCNRVAWDCGSWSFGSWSFGSWSFGSWSQAEGERCRETSVMSSSCSCSAPVKLPSSVRHRSISASPDGPLPTRAETRGKPNISRSGACASARPSLCSRAQSPGSNWKRISS